MYGVSVEGVGNWCGKVCWGVGRGMGKCVGVWGEVRGSVGRGVGKCIGVCGERYAGGCGVKVV